VPGYTQLFEIELIILYGSLVPAGTVLWVIGDDLRGVETIDSLWSCVPVYVNGDWPELIPLATAHKLPNARTKLFPHSVQ